MTNDILIIAKKDGEGRDLLWLSDLSRVATQDEVRDWFLHGGKLLTSENRGSQQFITPTKMFQCFSKHGGMQAIVITYQGPDGFDWSCRSDGPDE